MSYVIVDELNKEFIPDKVKKRRNIVGELSTIFREIQSKLLFLNKVSDHFIRILDSMHTLISTKDYITNFMLTIANIDNKTALWGLDLPCKEIKIISDKDI